MYKRQIKKILRIMRDLVTPHRILKKTLPYGRQELIRLNARKGILKNAKQNGVGAEIGVFRGLFTDVIARKLSPTRIYLVDPWTKLGETFPWRQDSPMTAQGRLTTQQALQDTKKTMARYPHIEAHFIEDYSSNFFAQLKEKLDWIYLDSSHSYDDTLKELHLAAAALKDDGVIMGDDWRIKPRTKHGGVTLAVNDFIRSTDYDLVEAGYGQQYCLRKRLQRRASRKKNVQRTES